MLTWCFLINIAEVRWSLHLPSVASSVLASFSSFLGKSNPFFTFVYILTEPFWCRRGNNEEAQR